MIPGITKEDFCRQLRSSIAKDSLAEFVEMTSGFELHPWQRLLCERLERLSREKGQRLLISAPPQVGKSQIVSKRFPAWLVWRNKTIRIILAAYNKTHSGGLIDAAKAAAMHEIVGGDVVWVRSNDDDGTFSAERMALNDAQPSLIGVGLDSGFTGKNADLLLIDDPYPNAEDARSEAHNRKVRSFWEETAEPRLMANPDSNVVVMFHRYHENDIAGYLMSKGYWEVITFPAIADGDPNDPTGREFGEVLSPFHSKEWLLRKQAEDPKTFAGQFQGKPLADGERLFEPWMFEDRFVDPMKVPPLSPWYRGVDTAYEEKAYSDQSATVRMAYDVHGNLWLRGFEAKKLQPGQMVEWMEALAEREGRAVQWVVEQHNAGFAVIDRLRRLGFSVIGQKIGAAEGSKLQRAFVLHDLAYAKRVFVVQEGAWQEFMAQLFAFTGDPKLKEKDDLIDAVTVVTTFLRESASKVDVKTPPNRFLAGLEE